MPITNATIREPVSLRAAYKMRATSKVVETIWIFEKETDKLFDDTPVYEGVIIEYLHRVKVRSCLQNNLSGLLLVQPSSTDTPLRGD